jgi:hypothetical protein
MARDRVFDPDAPWQSLLRRMDALARHQGMESGDDFGLRHDQPRRDWSFVSVLI